MITIGSRAGRTATLIVAALAALLAAQLAVPVPAEAAEFDRYAFYREALAATPAQAPGPPATDYGFYGAECYEDPTDDVFLLGQETSTPAAFGPADVTEYCVGLGSTLTFTLDVDEPRDPATDDSFKGITFVAWAVDTDEDDTGDFFVSLFRNADGELVGQVADIRGDEDVAPIVCDDDDGLVAEFVDGSYVLRGIPSSCLGDPEQITADGSITLDDDGDGNPDDDDVYFDAAPNEATFPAQPIPAAKDRTSERIGGADRFETAALISQRQFPNGADVAYLAEAALFADAVSGGSLTDGPILLVPSDGPVPQPVLAEVRRLNVDRVVGLGGTAAIADQVLNDTAQGKPTSRLAGPNRIATSVEIARAVFPNGADRVFLARADVFADAVAAGSLTQGPVVLIPSDGEVPREVREVLDEIDPETVTALGGTAAVSDSILEAAAAERDTDRIFGANRITTSVAISEFQFDDSATVETTYLARADVFADAVAGGTLTDGPILLVPTCGELPVSVTLEIQRTDPDTVAALGGTAAICNDILEQAADV